MFILNNVTTRLHVVLEWGWSQPMRVACLVFRKRDNIAFPCQEIKHWSKRMLDSELCAWSRIQGNLSAIATENAGRSSMFFAAPPPTLLNSDWALAHSKKNYGHSSRDQLMNRRPAITTTIIAHIAMRIPISRSMFVLHIHDLLVTRSAVFNFDLVHMHR